MKLDDIINLWELDSKIDKTQLDIESLLIPSLHHKYYKIYVQEKLFLRKYENELKELKLEKYEFLTEGPSKETQEKGWKLPPKGRIIKSEVPIYLESDKEIINLTLKIGVQQEKTELLESILKTLANRGFQIKNAIDFIRFQNGS